MKRKKKTGRTDGRRGKNLKNTKNKTVSINVSSRPVYSPMMAALI